MKVQTNLELLTKLQEVRQDVETYHRKSRKTEVLRGNSFAGDSRLKLRLEIAAKIQMNRREDIRETTSPKGSAQCNS